MIQKGFGILLKNLVLKLMEILFQEKFVAYQFYKKMKKAKIYIPTKTAYAVGQG